MDTSLRHKHMRQMRVTVERNAVRRQTQRLFQRRLKAGQGLSGQTIDQIDRHRFEAGITRRQQHIARLLEALNTIHRHLHQRIEILNPQAHAVKAQIGQQMGALRVDRTRINFNGILALGQELEAAAQNAHQPRHFFIGQEGRRAAAPMQLGDGAGSGQFGHLHVDFAFQVIQITRGFIVILGNDFVTTAVVADLTTEGQMHI